MSQAKIIKHMIITVLIVILSAFLWQSIPNDNGANIAKLFDNRDILVTFDGFTQLPNIVIIKNLSNDIYLCLFKHIITCGDIKNNQNASYPTSPSGAILSV